MRGAHHRARQPHRFLTACDRREEPTPPAAGLAALIYNEWESFRDEFIETFCKAHPAFAVRSGRHDFDGQLPDWSKTGIAAEIRRLHEARDRPTAFDAGLTEAQIFKRDHLIARIDRDLFWLETAAARFRNPTFYFDWNLDDLDPSPYFTREYAPLDQRMRSFLGYSRSIPRVAKEIRENLRLPHVAWRDFQDEFMSLRDPPIPLLRVVMMGGGEGSLF